MGTFVFDSGALFGISKSQANPTPVKLGSLQGIEAELAFDLRYSPLQFQAAIGAAVNKLDLTFTAKLAQLNGLLVNQLFFGQALSAGGQRLARDVAAVVPGTPYQLTPVVPNSGTWVQDLGVQYDGSGEPLVLVPSGPTVGQYSVSAGVYTFAAADTALKIVINYLYSVTTGNSLVLANSFKQLAPYFQVVLSTLYDGKQITWNLPRCTSDSFKLLTSVNSFAIPNFKFKAMADLTPPLGTIGTFSFSD